jgi:hypothetical protein
VGLARFACRSRRVGVGTSSPSAMRKRPAPTALEHLDLNRGTCHFSTGLPGEEPMKGTLVFVLAALTAAYAAAAAGSSTAK